MAEWLIAISAIAACLVVLAYGLGREHGRDAAREETAQADREAERLRHAIDEDLAP